MSMSEVSTVPYWEKACFGSFDKKFGELFAEPDIGFAVSDSSDVHGDENATRKH